MPYPAPSLETLRDQAAAYLEAALVRRAQAQGHPATSEAIARAVRSPRGAAHGIVAALAAASWSEHQGLGWLALQLFADTADGDILEGQHAAGYALTRRPATRAIGRVLLTGEPALAVPAELEIRAPTGAILAVTEGGALDALGVGTFAVRAREPGPEGNVAGGAVLPLVVALPGLEAQVAEVDADGVAGGEAIETDLSLLERYLARKRQIAMGGAAHDYEPWVRAAFAASHVGVIPLFAGLGTVGVVVAMGTRAVPRPPTPAETEAISRHLGRPNGTPGLRPATADVGVLAATLRPVPLTLEVEPDTAGVRAAVAQAFAAFLEREGAIGRPVVFSRLSEAISSAAGEYRHVLMAPTRDVALGPLELPVPGPITWVAP